MPDPATVSAIADTITAISAAVAAGLAFYGVKAWARELHGRTQFEVARALAKTTYKFRDAIQAARSPIIWAGEFPAEHNRIVNPSAQEKAEAYAHVYQARLHPVWEAHQEFDAQTLEAEVLWGRSIREKTDQLRAIARTLNAAVDAMIDNTRSDGEAFRQDREFGQKIRSEVSAQAADAKNELNQRIAAAVKEIEQHLLGHLRRQA